MKTLTAAQQQAMAGDVQYELDEFRSAIQAIPSLNHLRGSGRRSEWNRALESALLHFRNLRDFFFKLGKPHRDDVFAEHYVKRWRPKPEAVFDTTKERIDKLLAHLSLGRLQLSREWPELDEMQEAIERGASQFKQSLSPEQAKWFPRLDRPKIHLVIGAGFNSTASGPR